MLKLTLRKELFEIGETEAEAMALYIKKIIYFPGE